MERNTRGRHRPVGPVARRPVHSHCLEQYRARIDVNVPQRSR